MNYELFLILHIWSQYNLAGFYFAWVIETEILFAFQQKDWSTSTSLSINFKRDPADKFIYGRRLIAGTRPGFNPSSPRRVANRSNKISKKLRAQKQKK